MARHTGPKHRLSRREGVNLTGTRSESLRRRLNRPPGAHGDRGVRRRSEYADQLRAKQRLKRRFGMTEKQFLRTFEEAVRAKDPTGDALLKLLERRLDNVVYRLGYTTSRAEARQLVKHGHFAVNGKKASTPSILVKPGWTIEVRDRSKEMGRIAGALETAESRAVPQWLEIEKQAMKGTVKALPQREDVTLPIDEQLIVELYSR